MGQIKQKGKWKIILTNRVRKLGKRGDILNVSPGYFRNYLSKGLAISFSEKGYANIQSTLTTNINENYETEAITIKEKLDKKHLFFSRQASGTSVLFGSISAKDISKYIQENFETEVFPSRIFIDTQIKNIGVYKVVIELTEKVIFNVLVSVGRSIDEAKELATNEYNE